MNTPAPPSQWRSRLVLLLIVAMFFGSFGVAAFLRFTGWTPAHTRNFGQLLEPPIDVNDVSLVLSDDTHWQWKNDDRRWTALLRLPPALRRFIRLPDSKDCVRFIPIEQFRALRRQAGSSLGMRAKAIRAISRATVPAHSTGRRHI